MCRSIGKKAQDLFFVGRDASLEESRLTAALAAKRITKPLAQFCNRAILAHKAASAVTVSGFRENRSSAATAAGNFLSQLPYRHRGKGIGKVYHIAFVYITFGNDIKQLPFQVT